MSEPKLFEKTPLRNVSIKDAELEKVIFRAGDLVTIRIDSQDAEYLNDPQVQNAAWSIKQIVKHDPMPFWNLLRKTKE